MIRHHLHWTLASVAALLLSTAAAAQTSPAGPGKEKGNTAALGAAHAGDKPGAPAAAGKGDDKPAADAKDGKDAKGKGADPAAREADRALRVKAQHDAEASQLKAVLHGPMTEALKQELRHHAQRVAKLERIRSLATDAKDTATVDKATKLLDKENSRYEKWLATLGTKTESNGSNQAKAGAQ